MDALLIRFITNILSFIIKTKDTAKRKTHKIVTECAQLAIFHSNEMAHRSNIYVMNIKLESEKKEMPAARLYSTPKFDVITSIRKWCTTHTHIRARIHSSNKLYTYTCRVDNIERKPCMDGLHAVCACMCICCVPSVC